MAFVVPVTGRTTKAIGPPLSVVAGLNYPRGLLSPSRSSVAQLVSVLVRSSSLSSRRSRAHLVLPISATRHPSGFFFLFPGLNLRGGRIESQNSLSRRFLGQSDRENQVYANLNKFRQVQSKYGGGLQFGSFCCSLQ